MRISDGSSDVCSSDLNLAEAAAKTPMRAVDSFPLLFNRPIGEHNRGLATGEALAHLKRLEVEGRVKREDPLGRASCRDRVCQYVSISVGAVSLKQNTIELTYNYKYTK